ncbi:MAG: SDR family NAD(P)-dependent oxidoreductase [Acidobacteriota bacterium]
MKEFRGKVAVVTGAASGIGRALALRCAAENMQVVVADIEESALGRVETELKDSGANTLAVLTDVSNAEDVETLARKTLERFGAVHLLCNNAGIGAGSTAWESTLKDWEWTLGVNLWGVIHGLRAFVPAMLEQDSESHIVNTASVAGLISFHLNAPYQVSKHAVVGLSEKLHYDLEARAAKVKVSVLCPGWVRTRIMDSHRNRPAELENDPAEVEITPEMMDAVEGYRQACESGIPPEKVLSLTSSYESGWRPCCRAVIRCRLKN